MHNTQFHSLCFKSDQLEYVFNCRLNKLSESRCIDLFILNCIDFISRHNEGRTQVYLCRGSLTHWTLVHFYNHNEYSCLKNSHKNPASVSKTHKKILGLFLDPPLGKPMD